MTTKEHNAALFQEWNNNIGDKKTLIFCVFIDNNLKPSIAAVPILEDPTMFKAILLDLLLGIDTANKITYNKQ